MRRNRRNGAGDTVIDLTSLLDVIFIILLAIFVGQKDSYDKQLEEAEAREAAANQNVQAARTSKAQYDNLKKTSDHLNEYVYIISISAVFDETDVKKRTISLMSDDGMEMSFPLIGSDTDAYDDMKDGLEEYIGAHSGSPVILALNSDDEDILYRDEKKISDILFSLSSEHENVYVKGHTGEAK